LNSQTSELPPAKAEEPNTTIEQLCAQWAAVFAQRRAGLHLVHAQSISKDFWHSRLRVKWRGSLEMRKVLHRSGNADATRDSKEPARRLIAFE
jgi:hypothetical protein